MRKSHGNSQNTDTKPPTQIFFRRSDRDFCNRRQQMCHTTVVICTTFLKPDYFYPYRPNFKVVSVDTNRKESNFATKTIISHE